ncbi:amidohydrolase family protein [Nonomuraea sp. SYSU D8015]|uniref:amidohydrolase family protein n=1 Tax=Nonomuraea sp. SYSU D8015 TaxID=2593644 RepID=UPI001CB71FEA|nr:amidohydrolase family protein [Nonomuraea sp. SYSU D8015]
MSVHRCPAGKPSLVTEPMHLRGIALPSEEAVEFWVRDGLLTDEPVPGATTVVDGGWLLPGLVDAHTHPGAEQPGDPLDADLLRRHGREHLAAGVTLLRVPGSADRLPSWYGTEPDQPDVVSAGRWLGLPGMFYEGWARHVGEAELAGAAVQEALASGGWCKIYADWVVDEGGLDGPHLPADRLAEATRRVHAAGGRVAVHTQTAEGARAAVEAGVDSVEHGLGLELDLLDRMAAQRTALVPTFTVWRTFEQVARASRSTRFRDWFRAAHARLGPLVSAAYEAGVTVLAGTDSYGTAVLPHGRVSGEVHHLAAAPMPVAAAIGAASWTARCFLGFPCLEPGAPAEVVAYGHDPRADPGVLGHPARIVHRGRLVR